jgi:hypothetical protein
LAGACLTSLYGGGRTIDRAIANSDFAAYYCAGTVARSSDPYHAEAIEACRSGASNPAPLPGYAIAFFSAVSFLPYEPASIAWEVLLAFALLTTVWALRCLTGISPFALAAAVIGTDLLAGVSFGQLSVITALGVALCALFLADQRPRAAAFAALLTLAQPQIGVPLALALIIWAPRTRLVIVLGAGLLVALSFLHLGLSQNAEYVERVLPAFAAGEIPLRFQYGLGWILYFFGLDETRAFHIATLQYAVTVLLAIVVAPAVARRLEAPGVLAAFPALAAVLGGPSVHLSDLAVALPFAAIAAGSARGRTMGWLALMLLSVPWVILDGIEQSALGAVTIAAVALFTMADRSWLVRGTVAAMAAALALGTPYIVAGIPATPLRPAASTFDASPYGDSLTAVEHANAIRTQVGLTTPTWPSFVLKAPDWLGLALAFLAGLAALLGRGEPLERDDDDDADLPGFAGLKEEN